MRKLSSILVAVALTLSTGVNAAYITISTSTGGIYDVDTTTGAASFVASGVVLTDIAMDASGNLWGVDFDDLYSIDVNTNTFTKVGSLAAYGMNALTFNNSGTTLYGANFTNNNFYSIDTTSGSATSLGAGGYASAGDLAFNSAGDLFFAADTGSNDTLASVNTGTWSSSAIGLTGINDAYGLAFVDGVMYGVSAAKGMYTINTSTGVATHIVNITGITGDVYGATISAVPVPAAVWLFASGLLGLLGFSRRRI
jgi:Repeat of unknown function (DUF6923)